MVGQLELAEAECGHKDHHQCDLQPLVGSADCGCVTTRSMPVVVGGDQDAPRCSSELCYFLLRCVVFYLVASSSSSRVSCVEVPPGLLGLTNGGKT